MKNQNQTRDPASRKALWIMSSLLLGGAVAAVLHYDHTIAAVVKPTDPPETVAIQQVVAIYLSGPHDNLAAVRSMLSSTDNLMHQFLASPSESQVSLSKLRTDPFCPALAVENSASTASDQHNTDRERIAMLQDVQRLQLQSVVNSGDHPTCMIDNRFYREGEQIGSFMIERIDQSEVVVRNGDYRFELRIAG